MSRTNVDELIRREQEALDQYLSPEDVELVTEELGQLSRAQLASDCWFLLGYGQALAAAAHLLAAVEVEKEEDDSVTIKLNATEHEALNNFIERADAFAYKLKQLHDIRCGQDTARSIFQGGSDE